MKLLEIYPSYCWSYNAESRDALEALRAAASLPDPQEQLASLNRLRRSGQACRIVGKATSLELADKFYDDVIFRYDARGPERALLEQKKSRWLKRNVPEPRFDASRPHVQRHADSWIDRLRQLGRFSPGRLQFGSRPV
jgi:hypothetical protein